MEKSWTGLKTGPFNAIYAEERALKYPIAGQVIEKYPECPVIPIKHYKDVFNRTNQDFRLQKQHQSLILAVKESPSLYKGPGVCQDFGHLNFHYTSVMLNCLFDCEYCFLQGMYPSAYPVAFVNIEDFQHAIEDAVQKEPLYLAASYDTDLIAFHSVIPYADYFYDLLAKHPGLTVEIRTKSANLMFFEKHAPLDNLITAFSLAPDEIVRQYEAHTPSLETRLKAVRAAISQGFIVRLCFDPVFIGPEVDGLYEQFYRRVFSAIDPVEIRDVGYGFFRMPVDFFKRIAKRRQDSKLYSENYCANEGVVSYPAALQDQIKEKHLKILSRYIGREKIFSTAP